MAVADAKSVDSLGLSALRVFIWYYRWAMRMRLEHDQRLNPAFLASGSEVLDEIMMYKFYW